MSAEDQKPDTEAQKRTHAELIKLYEVTIADVDRTKEWQWKVFYYTIVAQGASFGLFLQDTVRANIVLRLTAVSFVLLLGLVGVVELWKSGQTLQKFRDRLGRCLELFSDNFKTAFGDRNQPKPQPLMVRVLALITAVVGLAMLVA